MKTIKTRSTVRNIKVLDKSVNASKRMKDTFIRTKNTAEETQEPRYDTQTDYATEKVQYTAQSTVQKTVHNSINPLRKVSENWSRAKGHFREVTRNLPKECRRTSGQAQNTAIKTRDNAEKLQNAAGKAQDTAKEAKTAVKDAKNTLREVRHSGRQTLREVKQATRLERGGVPKVETGVKDRIPRFRKPSGRSVREGAMPKKTLIEPLNDSISRPNYISVRTKPYKSASGVVKTPDKSAKAVNSTQKSFKKTTKGTVKTAKKSVKTAKKSAKAAVKTAKRSAKAARKTAQTAVQAAKVAERAAFAAAKAAVTATKITVKVVSALVKAAIAAIKGLVAAIAAGGWVAVLVILLICLIGLLVSSIFGIFFSDEPSKAGGKTINSVIAEIDTEYTAQIDAITDGNAHDLLDISGARAGWKEVLAVYTVEIVTDPDNPMEAATIDDEKEALLRSVFWEMNTITHTTDSAEVEEDALGGDGLPTGETTTVAKTVLRITVTHKSTGEMAVKYGFDDGQTAQLEELLKPEYHYLWNGLLYGISGVGDGSMISVAATQFGNIGGEIYWRWYGFDSRVEWCACFVSWVAEQCGFIEAGVIPRFAACSVGIQWFKEREQWRDKTFTPAPGDIIFFDWENDGKSDHVGIVESVNDGKVNTIEGNSSDSVARRSYVLGGAKIYGYGVMVNEK